MAGPPITQFEPDPERLRPLAYCMPVHAGRDPNAEWPYNLLSRRTVAYGDGKIAREGDPVVHRVDPDELALCRRLADEARVASKDGYFGFGMNTEGHFEPEPFFVAANVDDPVPDRIDEALIRARFGGTIFPPAPVTVAPLDESGRWWSDTDGGRGHYGAEFRDVTADELAADDELAEEYREQQEAAGRNLESMRRFMRWFRDRPEFKDAAYVAIGEFYGYRFPFPPEAIPPGTESPGSALPRLIVGLTHAGSLAGLFGHVVLT